MLVDGATLTGPQGSNDAVIPAADNNYAHVAGLWDEIGMPRSFDFVAPAGAASSLKFARDHYDPMYWNENASTLGYYFDKPFASKRAWVIDPWSDDLQRAPISSEARRSWLQWKKHTPILTHGNEAATDRWLDSMSYGDLIVRELKLSKDVFKLSDPLVATGDYGVSSDAVSAYGAKLLGLPGTGENIISDDVFSFPGGNAAILRHIVKALFTGCLSGTRSFCRRTLCTHQFCRFGSSMQRHAHIRLGATVVAVRHDGTPESGSGVNVTYRVERRTPCASAAKPPSSQRAAGSHGTSCAIYRPPTLPPTRNFITDRYWSRMWRSTIGRPSRNSASLPRIGSTASDSS